MKFKKIVCIFLVVMLLTTSAMAAGNTDIKVVLDGKEINFDVSPTVINGRTMVPLRAIFESLGATVDWDNETRTVTSVKDDIKVSLKLNDTIMSVNDKKITLDVPATAVSGRTLVPVRAISEAFGCEVLWDGQTRTVTINRNAEEKEIFQFQSMDWDYDSYMKNIEERIVVGYDCVAIVDSNHNLFAWGNNNNGQFPIDKVLISKPTLIKENVVKMVIGKDFSLILSMDGSVSVCKDKVETKLALPKTIVDIDCGDSHCLALDKDGNVYGWGVNAEKSLVIPNVDSVDVPQKILSNVEKMTAGEDFSLFLFENKTLMSTKALGLSKSGKIKLSKASKESLKQITPNYDGVEFYQIATSVDDFIYDNSVLKVVSNETTSFMFPGNYASYGKKAETFDYSKLILTKNAELNIVDSDLYVSGNISNCNFNNTILLSDVKYVKNLECGAFVAVLNDGSIWTFGKNENYALGDGKKSNLYYPTPVFELFPDLSESNSDKVEISVLSSDDYSDGYNIELQFKDSDGNIITPCGLATIVVSSLGRSIYHESVYLTSKDYKKQVATLVLPSSKVKSFSKDGEAYITFKNSYTLSDSTCAIENLPKDTMTDLEYLEYMVDLIKEYISDIQYSKSFTINEYNYYGQLSCITKINSFNITDVKIGYSDNLRVWCTLTGVVVGSDYCSFRAKCYDEYGYVVATPVVIFERISQGEEFRLKDSFYVPIGTKRIEFVESL